MRKLIAFMTAAMMALSLAACGGSGGSGDAASGAGGGVSSGAGGEILFGVPADVSSLDPQTQNDSYSEEVVKMVYNTLYVFDENNTPVPSLAESYEVSEDNLSWTFHLRTDVKFHNGKTLTAKDVEASFNRALPEDSGYITTSMISPIESVTAADDATVVIKTKEPYGPMLSLLCNYNTAIMDSDFIEQYGRDLGNTRPKQSTAQDPTRWRAGPRTRRSSSKPTPIISAIRLRSAPFIIWSSRSRPRVSLRLKTARST